PSRLLPSSLLPNGLLGCLFDLPSRSTFVSLGNFLRRFLGRLLLFGGHFLRFRGDAPAGIIGTVGFTTKPRCSTSVVRGWFRAYFPATNCPLFESRYTTLASDLPLLR